MSGPTDSKSLLDGLAKLLSKNMSGPAPASKPRFDDEKCVVLSKPANASATPSSLASLSTDVKSKSDSKSDPASAGSADADKQGAFIKLARELLEGRSGESAGPEQLKRYQYVIVNTQAVSNPAAAPAGILDAMTIGTNYYQRIAEKIRVHEIRTRMQFEWFCDTTDTANLQPLIQAPVRVIIYLDKFGFVSNVPTYGTELAVDAAQNTTDFESVLTTLGAGQPANITAPFNTNTHGYRYEILADEVVHPVTFGAFHTVGGSHISSWGSATKEIFIKKPFNVWNVDPGTSLVDSVNRLCIYVIHDNSMASPPIFTATFDVKFSDLFV